MRKAIASAVTLLVMAGCSTTSTSVPYWDRAGATRTQLVDDSSACYRASFDDEYPSALPGAASTSQLLPRSEPPPRVWTLAPRDTGFGRFDEQLRYERCMRDRGWSAGRTAPLTR
jgi:hypothetical protein